MQLQYQISTIGLNQLRAVLRSVEREVVASNKRMGVSTREAVTGARGGRSVASAGRQQAQQLREAAKAERERSREVLSNARKEEKARITAERNVARAKENLDKQRSRGLLSQYRAEEREVKRVAKQQEAARASLREKVSGGFARSVGGTLGTVARVGGAALGIAGGFGAAEAIRENLDVKRRASDLANQAGNPALKGQIANEATSVRGFSGSETLSAMGGFVTKTGDLSAARGAIQDLGRLSLATGTDFGEMGEAAGQAFNVIRDTITDPKQQLIALNDVMTTLAGQGNLGAVEIRDMATQLAGLGAATRVYKGGPVELLKSMGAIAQASVARGGASSASEATTAVTRFAADLTKHPAQKALSGLGINVFADKGKTQLKDPAEIMADILAKTKGNMPQIEEILNAESAKALRGFSPLYLNAEKNKKGSGKAALMAEFGKFTGAGLSKGDIEKRANSRLEDPDLQWKEAMKNFNTAVGRELVPVVTKLVGQFTELLPLIATGARVFGKLIAFFTEHPVAGLGLLIGGAIVKDIISANIGKMIQGTIGKATAFAARKSGATVDEEGNVSLGGKLGAAATGATIGLTVATAIITAGVANFEKADQSMDEQAKALASVRGSSDPEAVRREVQEQRKRVQKLHAPSFFGETIGGVIDAAVDPTKGTQIQGAESTLAAMEAQLTKLDALKEAADSIKTSSEATTTGMKALTSAANRLNGANRTDPIVSPNRAGT